MNEKEINPKIIFKELISPLIHNNGILIFLSVFISSLTTIILTITNIRQLNIIQNIFKWIGLNKTNDIFFFLGLLDLLIEIFLAIIASFILTILFLYLVIWFLFKVSKK